MTAVRSGELKKDDPDLKPFESLFCDMYVEQDVVFQGSRLVIPTKQQKRLLHELHQTHIGMVKIKKAVRKYFWWPRISKEIDEFALSCEGCRKYRKKPPPAPLCPWPYSRRPMERVHVDFAEYRGKMLLIMIDSFSKFIWCHIMNNDTTTQKTLMILYGWFCERGFPTTLVSDNGPQFTAKEFGEKMSKWGVKHLLTPPYHPASNGLAEKAVGTVKDRLKKMDCPVTSTEFYVNIKRIVYVCNATSQASTDQNPFELMARAPVPSLFPQLQLSQNKTQEQLRATVPQKKLKSMKMFRLGDRVLVYNTQSKTNCEGVIKDVNSNNSYTVLVNGLNRHISGDHMSLISDKRLLNVNEDNPSVESPVRLPKESFKDVREDNVDGLSETMSIESDDDDDDEFVYNLPASQVPHSVPMQPVSKEVNRLFDSLSGANPIIDQKLRPRKSRQTQ